ncbi:MAG: hypothetical protein D6813_02110 [Calditrichaeota bacterium]|nr:MAG: hypothetical protein D6813_02110 [Calditrichota bacterium]
MNNSLSLDRPRVLIAAYIIFLIFMAFFISVVPPRIILGFVFAFIIFVVSFMNTEAALYLLIFSMLLSPEVGSRGTGGGGATLRMDDFLLLIIGISWLVRMAIYKELGLILKTKINRPIFYYIFVCFISTALGILAGRVKLVTGVLFVIKYIEYFVVFFMVTHLLHQKKQIKNFLIALFITCIIVCLIAIAQIPSGERVTAPFEGSSGEPNTLGGYLVFMLALVVGLILHLKVTRYRIFLGGLAGLIILPLLYTLSRSSWIALIPMYLTLIITTHYRIFLVGMLILVVLLGPIFLPASVKERINYTFQKKKIVEWQAQIGNVTLDTSSSARLHDWKLAFKAFLKKPVLGYGITGWHFIDSQYVRTLVELGLVGLIVFLSMIYAILKETWLIYRQVTPPSEKGLAFGLFLGTIGLLTHSIGANTFIIVRIMEPFWFIVGMVIMLPLLEKKDKDQTMGTNQLQGELTHA